MFDIRRKKIDFFVIELRKMAEHRSITFPGETSRRRYFFFEEIGLAHRSILLLYVLAYGVFIPIEIAEVIQLF